MLTQLVLMLKVKLVLFLVTHFSIKVYTDVITVGSPPATYNLFTVSTSTLSKEEPNSKVFFCANSMNSLSLIDFDYFSIKWLRSGVHILHIALHLFVGLIS